MTEQICKHYDEECDRYYLPKMDSRGWQSFLKYWHSCGVISYKEYTDYLSFQPRVIHGHFARSCIAQYGNAGVRLNANVQAVLEMLDEYE